MNKLRQALKLLEKAEELVKESGKKGFDISSFNYHVNEAWLKVYHLLEEAL